MQDHHLPRSEHGLRDGQGVDGFFGGAAARVPHDVGVAWPEPEQRGHIDASVHAGEDGQLHGGFDGARRHAEIVHPGVEHHLVDGVHRDLG